MLPLDETGFAPFVPPQFGIKLAREAWELRAHFALRRATFCREQGLFEGDDRDAIDARGDAIAIVAVSFVMGGAHEVLGTVRIHDAGDGRWRGSRLAIDPGYRSVHGLGRALVGRAVATAAARGCSDFSASVQLPNVDFFRSLGWSVTGATAIAGREHALMTAPIAEAGRYVANDETIAMLRAHRAS